MKQILTLALALPALAASAQTLTNDGATITVQAGATLYVAGSVLNKAGSTLVNDGAVQTTGDLTNTATAASLGGAGLLRFSGTTDQTLTSPAGTTLANLEVANTGSAGANRLLLPADLTVSNQLTLTNGLLRTAPAATLLLPEGATLTGEAAGRYVQGNLQAVRNAVSGSAPIAFPNSASLSPNGQNLGTVTITRTAGLQTAGLSYGQNLTGTNRGIDRVWTVVATGNQPTAATPATVALTWLADDDNGFATGTNAQLWRSTSAAGPWGKLGAPASAASRSFVADISQLGALTISNISAPLPVELIRFTAEPLGQDALLKWATASEKNNDHFDVEASADGQVFRRIGTVPGHGSSPQPQEYQLTDQAIAHYAADPVYYRLRQVDADGTATYSPVRTVRVSGAAGFAAQLYPNPSRITDAPLLLVRTADAGPLRWQLADAVGRTVFSQSDALPAGASTVPLGGLSNLPTGVYLLRVQQGDHHQAIKLVRE